MPDRRCEAILSFEFNRVLTIWMSPLNLCKRKLTGTYLSGL